MLKAINFSKGPAYEILIAGEQSHPKTSELIEGIRKQFLPNSVVILVSLQDDELKSWLPHLQNYRERDNGEPLVYVCQNFACKLPTSDIEEVLVQLSQGK